MTSTENKIAAYRREFANYTMVERGAEPARIFQVRPPGGSHVQGFEVVILGGVGVADRIVVTGDLCPTNNGCVSNVGYGLGWFAGRKSDDYLCGKFLRQTWVPELALAALRGRIEDEAKDAVDQELDQEERDEAAERRDALEEALAGAEEEGEDDPTRSQEAFGEMWRDVYDDGPEDIGMGYEPKDAALLISIQETFARLYWAAHPASEPEAPPAPAAQVS